MKKGTVVYVGFTVGQGVDKYIGIFGDVAGARHWYKDEFVPYFAGRVQGGWCEGYEFIYRERHGGGIEVVVAHSEWDLIKSELERCETVVGYVRVERVTVEVAE